MTTTSRLCCLADDIKLKIVGFVIALDSSPVCTNCVRWVDVLRESLVLATALSRGSARATLIRMLSEYFAECQAELRALPKERLDKSYMGTSNWGVVSSEVRDEWILNNMIFDRLLRNVSSLSTKSKCILFAHIAPNGDCTLFLFNMPFRASVISVALRSNLNHPEYFEYCTSDDVYAEGGPADGHRDGKDYKTGYDFDLFGDNGKFISVANRRLVFGIPQKHGFSVGGLTSILPLLFDPRHFTQTNTHSICFPSLVKLHARTVRTLVGVDEGPCGARVHCNRLSTNERVFFHEDTLEFYTQRRSARMALKMQRER